MSHERAMQFPGGSLVSGAGFFCGSECPEVSVLPVGFYAGKEPTPILVDASGQVAFIFSSVLSILANVSGTQIDPTVVQTAPVLVINHGDSAASHPFPNDLMCWIDLPVDADNYVLACLVAFDGPSESSGIAFIPLQPNSFGRTPLGWKMRLRSLTPHQYAGLRIIVETLLEVCLIGHIAQSHWFLRNRTVGESSVSADTLALLAYCKRRASALQASGG